MAGQALVYFNVNITFLLQEAFSIRNQEAFAITSVLVLCRWIQIAVKYIFCFIERHRNFKLSILSMKMFHNDLTKKMTP